MRVWRALTLALPCVPSTRKWLDGIDGAAEGGVMSNAFNDDLARPAAAEDAGIQPLRDGDATSEADPSLDPAQQEWDRTDAIDEALDAGVDPADLDVATATGDDPAHLVDDTDEIPATDQPSSGLQPESQGDDPIVAELGEDGEGDLSDEDL
ncbi:hypothetical protein GCM10017586_27200 [Microbacterium imperiale]|uniref:Sugar ABC transporter ATPase n=2 Tax=Microbacterium imperiale TaxID=33884 RepID=A0A9W6HIP2_9MICO|nr:hypothetical protein GCM10017586_27200 [Microbacterium imperiale]